MSRSTCFLKILEVDDVRFYFFCPLNHAPPHLPAVALLVNSPLENPLNLSSSHSILHGTFLLLCDWPACITFSLLGVFTQLHGLLLFLL